MTKAKPCSLGRRRHSLHPAVWRGRPPCLCHGINILGNCIISNSFFLYNNYDILESEDKDMHPLCQNRSLGLRKYRECIGGGALFFYNNDYVHSSSPQLHKLRVISSTFSHGINFGLHEGSGLTVCFEQSLYGVELTVERSVFTHNTAHTGANMAFILCHGVYNTSVTIQYCNSTNSNPRSFHINTSEYS